MGEKLSDPSFVPPGAKLGTREPNALSKLPQPNVCDPISMQELMERNDEAFRVMHSPAA